MVYIVDTEHLLANKPIGTFLIRPSSTPGSYVASFVINLNQTMHTLIINLGIYKGERKKGNKFHSFHFDFSRSMNELVERCVFSVFSVCVLWTRGHNVTGYAFLCS
jgi:hypothetical protein